MIICDRCREQTEVHPLTIACAGNAVCGANDQVHELCRDCCDQVRLAARGSVGGSAYVGGVWKRTQAIFAMDAERWRTVAELMEMLHVRRHAIMDNFYTRHPDAVEQRLVKGKKRLCEWRLLPSVKVAQPETAGENTKKESH